MINTSVTKEFIKDYGFETWFGFYGNILQSQRRDGGITVYVVIDAAGVSKSIETTITKDIFKKLALVELGLVLIEAKISGFGRLFELAKLDHNTAVEADFPLGYVRISPITNEVSYINVLIPKRFLEELQKENLEKIDAAFAQLTL